MANEQDQRAHSGRNHVVFPRVLIICAKGNDYSLAAEAGEIRASDYTIPYFRALLWKRSIHSIKYRSGGRQFNLPLFNGGVHDRFGPRIVREYRAFRALAKHCGPARGSKKLDPSYRSK